MKTKEKVKSNSCAVPKKVQSKEKKINYATLDIDQGKRNKNESDPDGEKLADNVDSINPDMNSMTSRG